MKSDPFLLTEGFLCQTAGLEFFEQSGHFSLSIHIFLFFHKAMRSNPSMKHVLYKVVTLERFLTSTTCYSRLPIKQVSYRSSIKYLF